MKKVRQIAALVAVLLLFAIMFGGLDLLGQFLHA